MTSFSTTRRVLAVMAVTTALCADQAVMASAARPQPVEIGQIASRLVTRLARNFQRSLPALIREPVHQQRAVDSQSVQPLTAEVIRVAHSPLSPFQFRLPPPAV